MPQRESQAVDRISLPAPQGYSRGRKTGRYGSNTWLQQSELREVSTVERQVHQLAAGHNVAALVRAGVDERRFAIDGNDVFVPHERESDVDASYLTHVQQNAFSGVTANLLFGLALIPLAIWTSKKFRDRITRSPLIQQVMKDLAGNNLNAAVTFLAILSEFEDERVW